MDADPTGTSIISSLLLLLFFTLMNAFFAGAEMAVVSVNKNRIRSLAEDGNKKAKVIEKLFDDSTKFLSTIQVAITFAGFYSSASAAARIAPVLGAWLASRGLPYAEAIASNGVTLLLMFFNLVFGELVPKRIALQKAEAFCMLTVMPVHYISIVLSPFIKLLSVSTKVVLKLLGFKTTDQEEAVTEEEIKALLKQGSETGLFEDEERKMIDSVFAFNDRTAREIRVPRRDVVSFDINEPFDTLLDDILATRHNRIPVYDDDIDNIIGVLHEKDFYAAYCRGAKRLSELKSSVLYTTETARISDLLRQLQQNKVHMAVVVDEYGGTQGIVTMEDIMEELVGEIWDEHDEVIEEFRKQSDGSYLVACSADLDDLYDLFDMKPSEEYDASSVSGWVMEEIGRVPDVGDRFRADGLEVCVTRVEHRRVMEIRVRRLPKEDAAPEKVHAHSGT